MKTFTKHILLLALMLFGVAGAAWASRAPQKFTGPVAFNSLVQGDTLAPGFELTGISVSDNLHFDGGRYSFNGTPQADAVAATIGTANSLSYTDGNIILTYGAATFTLAPMVDMTTAGNAWVVTDVYSNTNGSEIHISGISIDLAPDPTVPALDELTGNWNFLMPGSNKVVKAVLYDSIVLGPHVELFNAEPAFAAGDIYTRGDSTIYYYDTLHRPSFQLRADEQADGKYFGFWADLDPTDPQYTDRTYRYVSPGYTCGQRYTAAYPNNYTLSLAKEGYGTVKLDGVGVDTVYTITFEQSGISGDSRSFTIPASRFPYDTTFNYNANIVSVDAYDQMHESVSMIPQSSNTVTVRISGPFKYGGYYECELEGGASDNWTISCTATGTQPKMPYGISDNGDGTYSVMEGLTVNVTATPDSAHYLSAIDGHDTVSNHACGYSFVMPSSSKDLLAVFNDKPTLTLAQTDGGTLEAIVPQGGAIVENITADMVSNGWEGNFNTRVTLADLQAYGFMAVDETAAAAWTGAPAQGLAFLIYGFTTEGKVKLLEFYDGTTSGAPTVAFYNRGYVYNNRDIFYFATGAGTANVIASSTPNTYYIDYGTDVTVEAIPAEYYHLGHWANQAGTEVASVTPLTVTVTSDTTLMAVFERNMRILHGVPEGWTVMADSVTVAVSADSAVVPAGSQIMMIPPVPVKPTVKSFEVEKYLHPNEVPLTLEALTDGTIKVTEPKAGMRYAVNGGDKTGMSGTTQIDVTAGDKVAFYGNGTTIASYDGTMIAGGTAEVKVYGNIMSLVDEENFATATTLTETYTFRQLFYENYKLKDASGLLLPATTLTERCYEQMFTSDTILTAAPALPATTLAPYCYQSMFNFCYALTTAPALPATTMESNCYNQMFYYCTGLTTAPALPATTLAEECYSYMFYNCTGLTTAPALPATTLADYCYYYMFANDTNLTTAPSILPATTLASRCYQRMFHGCIRLTTAPKLPATTLANYCYNYMFAGCTSLTTAPELPATTLVSNCYAYMFQNCSNLRSVTCMATSGINSNNSTVKWLSNTAATGIFVANNAAEWPNNASGIPEGWNRTTTISFATASDCGKIVCSAGHLHDAGSQLPEGCTVVGIMAKVNTDGHGLILGILEGRLEDAYHPIDLFYPTVNYGGTTLKRLPGYMLENLPNCATLGNIPTSNWCVASMDDYKAMFVNLGSQSAEQSYDDNVNATIIAAGGKAITDGSEYQEWGFWCTSKYDDRHGWFFKKNSWSYADWEEDNTIYSRYLLPVLAF